MYIDEKEFETSAFAKASADRGTRVEDYTEPADRLLENSIRHSLGNGGPEMESDEEVLKHLNLNFQY